MLSSVIFAEVADFYLVRDHPADQVVARLVEALVNHLREIVENILDSPVMPPQRIIKAHPGLTRSWKKSLRSVGRSSIWQMTLDGTGCASMSTRSRGPPSSSIRSSRTSTSSFR